VETVTRLIQERRKEDDGLPSSCQHTALSKAHFHQLHPHLHIRSTGIGVICQAPLASAFSSSAFQPYLPAASSSSPPSIFHSPATPLHATATTTASPDANTSTWPWPARFSSLDGRGSGSCPCNCTRRLVVSSVALSRGNICHSCCFMSSSSNGYVYDSFFFFFYYYFSLPLLCLSTSIFASYCHL